MKNIEEEMLRFNRRVKLPDPISCIAYIANDAGWRAFKREVHPEDLKNFVRIQKSHDINGRVFTSVIRGYGWEDYRELYAICKTRIK